MRDLTPLAHKVRDSLPGPLCVLVSGVTKPSGVYKNGVKTPSSCSPLSPPSPFFSLVLLLVLLLVVTYLYVELLTLFLSVSFGPIPLRRRKDHSSHSPITDDKSFTFYLDIL